MVADKAIDISSNAADASRLGENQRTVGTTESE